MVSETKVKVDNPEPETEPVLFIDITLNCGRVLEIAVKPKQGDTWKKGPAYHLFTFPKFQTTQKVKHSQIAAEMVRESVIVKAKPLPSKEKA